MSLVAIFDAFAERELDRVAEEIEADLKNEVSAHWKSGKAYHCIHIEKKDKYVRWIGGTDGTGRGTSGTDHLLMLENGNGGKRIYPTHSKALRLTDGRGNTVTFAKSVKPYSGYGILKKVASKYR